MQKLLDKDHFGLNCRKSFWLDMRATPGVYEINTTGLLVDRERLDRQYDAFSARFKQLEKKLQRLFAWEETAPGRGDGLNINSVYHVREILYGTRLNGKKDDAGDPIRIRPEGAKTLKLTPLFDTAKRPTPWEKIVEEGREEKAAPSTGKTVLSILYAEATNPKIQDAIGLLRDCRYLNQAMRFTLRPPLRDKQDRILVDAAGRYQYGSGFGSFICDDERIRTHMLQAAETGRWRSARPPMQNWGKAREEDYQRILAELYTKPLRSVFKASPGHAFVEFDFKGAELFVTAIMSGDPTMIDHVYRNKLDEDDPNYIDIHSEIAVRAFRLNCAPTKAGLESIGRPKLRIAAKATIFGCLYGRQAKAIAIGCREQGAAVTLRDAQALIDSIFAMYPRLPDFFRACQDRAINERWIRNCAGRLRRFPWSGDFSVQGDMQRQAMNFPIQSAVADVVNVCVDRLRQYRRMSGSDLFRIALQIHDAILLEVPVQHVDEVVNRVVPICAERVPILPCNLSGQPLAGAQLHYLKSDVEVGEYWGEKLTIEACQRLGIHPKYAPPPKEKKPITVSA
jgi:hypothetical protein